MKKILTTALILSTFIVNSQSNFYKKDGKKVSIVGEQTILEFNDNITLVRPSIKKEGFAETLIATLLPSIIDLGIKISTDIIENKIKKYTSEFSVRNTYINEEKYISSFKVERKIKLKDKVGGNESAFSIEFQPIKVDENAFILAINDISTIYSGAKSKKYYNSNDYTIEIKISYFDGKEKKEQTSAPIIIQLFEIGNKNYPLKNSKSNFIYF